MPSLLALADFIISDQNRRYIDFSLICIKDLYKSLIQIRKKSIYPY